MLQLRLLVPFVAAFLTVSACGANEPSVPPFASMPDPVGATPSVPTTPRIGGASPLPSAEPALPRSATTPRSWVRIGEIPDAHVEEVVSFGAGYVARGGTGENLELGVWFSDDGSEWQKADLGALNRCGGIYPYAQVAAGSNEGVVVLGLEAVDDPLLCTGNIVAWASSDGVDWRRSNPFGDARIDGRAAAIWSAPDGWEALIGSVNGAHVLWRSNNGTSWTRVAEVEPVAELSPLLGAAVDPAGSRLISVSWGDMDPAAGRLYRSDDGEAWTEAGAQQPGPGPVQELLAPSRALPHWIAIATEQDREPWASTVWVSDDLETWRSAPFPMGSAESLISTSTGALLYARDVCPVTGGSCAVPDRPERYLESTDGLTWTSLRAGIRPTQFVEGTSGVIGFDHEGVAWRLEPYSDDEAYLFSGVRDDARFACAARRTDLPPRALAGVVCSPDVTQTSGVEEVGAYLFETDADMLDSYFERLAEEGIRPGQGACPASPGERSYQPEAPGDLGPARMGCFVNDFGNANLRITYPGEHVYVGILGTDRDMGALSDWVWEGNLDQPGSPTVWRPAGG